MSGMHRCILMQLITIIHDEIHMTPMTFQGHGCEGQGHMSVLLTGHDCGTNYTMQHITVLIISPPWLWSLLQTIITAQMLFTGASWTVEQWNIDEHQPAPVCRFCDSGAIYKCLDLLTYLFYTYLLNKETNAISRKLIPVSESWVRRRLETTWSWNMKTPQSTNNAGTRTVLHQLTRPPVTSSRSRDSGRGTNNASRGRVHRLTGPSNVRQ